MKNVQIYTDGSCLGNPGKGGYASILIYGEHQKIVSDGFRKTTSNRMELLGCIAGLNSLKFTCHVEMFTDSKYVQQGITNWIKSWKRNGWKTTNKKPVKNIDLWQKIDTCCEKHDINWNWIKGHNGNHFNEECDRLARASAENGNSIDVDYENGDLPSLF
ncbi:MAG: ribonuclease HI [Hormoscilla sp.]